MAVAPTNANEESLIQRRNLFRSELRLLHDKIWNCPEASGRNPVFSEPVDETVHQAPGYYSVIKEPMDLLTMKHKLEDGAYDDDARLYFDDFYRIVNNAIMFNRGQESKSVWIAEKAIRMERSVVEDIHKSFVKMGFCCGYTRTFGVRSLACYACKTGECQILRNKKYFLHKNGEYSVCETCYRKAKEEEKKSISIYPDQENSSKKKISTPLESFILTTNNVQTPEPFISCSKCTRKQHQLCVNFVKGMDESKYVCFRCQGRGVYARRIEHLPLDMNAPDPDIVEKNPVTSKMLLETPLSTFIEAKLRILYRDLSRRMGTQVSVPKIRIRVLSTSHRTFEVMKLMSALYSKTQNFPSSFPYKSRAIFAFQEQPDGRDLVIFALHVNEYGHDSSPPNHRMLYLSYLDSIQYFQPADDPSLRSRTYHEIVMRYMEYIRDIGYEKMIIWSCPPIKNDDYIFYCHPPEQKMPEPSKLLLWYSTLLDRAVSIGIVEDYSTLLSHSQDINISRITQLPYLHNDFWPKCFEEKIDEVIKDASIKDDEYDKELTDRIKESLDLEAEVFFYIRFATSPAAKHKIAEPDVEIDIELFNGRENFLTHCQKYFYEFGSLRNACHSTAQILFEVHVEQTKKVFEWGHKIHHLTKCKDMKCDRRDCKKHKILVNVPPNAMVRFLSCIHLGTPSNKVASANLQTVWAQLLDWTISRHVQICSRSPKPCDNPRCIKERVTYLM